MIDPATTASETLASARALFNNGELFRCYDLARDGLERWPQQTRLAHLAVLSLANAGATGKALDLFVDLELGRSNGQEERALYARLNKDLGFMMCGPDRERHHSTAEAIYEELYREALGRGAAQEAYYPGINAAATAVWGGDHPKGAQLAAEVQAILTDLPPAQSPEEQFWRLATSVEASLIAGDLDRFGRDLAHVQAHATGTVVQRATMSRQLHRLADALSLPPDLLSRFLPPAVMHFSGHIMAAPGTPGRLLPGEEGAVRQRIEQLLAEHNIGSGYGSLAAGADILFAEALLARGAALHVVLPFALDDFVTYSVRPAQQTWVARFEQCLARATSLRYATEDSFLDHDSLFRYCGQLAMGLAIVAARHLQAPAMQCVVWDGAPGHASAGTTVDMQLWRATGLPQHVIRCGSGANAAAFKTPQGKPSEADRGRTIRAMLFGDLHGFSKLTDRELPRFAEHVLRPVAAVVHRFKDRVSFVNTWGDGVFCVFEQVCDAAEWALAVQAAVAAIDLEKAGLPADLHLRLGGHLGPVYELMDPVLERPNFYGSHVSRAARIEPVTPGGCVYVTETFAAALALEDCGRYACDYAGYTEMAKHYGRLRMFLLRRVSGDSGPVALADIEQLPL